MSNPTFVADYEAITATLTKYIDGNREARSDIMKPAFSGQATIFNVGADGKLDGGPIQGLFDLIDTAFEPSPQARAVIASIDIAGTAASARVDSDDVCGYFFTDFFNLLKIDGQWTIVNKIYHTHVHP